MSQPYDADACCLTSFGLRDLDLLSPCTREDPCVLDKMIFEEVYGTWLAAGATCSNGRPNGDEKAANEV